MKKITMKQIEKSVIESKKGNGKVHIVVSEGEIKLWINGSDSESIKNSGVDYIYCLCSIESFLDAAVSFGQKTGWQEGTLADRINNYLEEKGYELEKDLIISLKREGGALYNCKVVFQNYNYVKERMRIQYWNGENVNTGTIKNVEDNGEYFTLVNCTDAFYKNKSIHISQICELEELV